MNAALKFSTISDEAEAKVVWDKISPKKVIDDEWNLRYNFFNKHSFKLHFIVGYDGDEVIGLLPLQLNNQNTNRPKIAFAPGDFLEFFGSDDTDNNVVMLKTGYEGIEEQFFAQIKIQAFLAPLAKPFTFNGVTAHEYDTLYHLDLHGFENIEDYFAKYWDGSSGSQLRKHMRKIYRDNTVEVTFGDVEHLQNLFDLNEKRFKEKSSFIDPVRQEIFFDLAKDFKNEIITVKVDGHIEAVSLGLHYKNSYIGLNSGTNRDFRDIGKLSVLLRIKRAIELGCTVYDSGKGSSGWKQRFGFVGIPQYHLQIS